MKISANFKFYLFYRWW